MSRRSDWRTLVQSEPRPIVTTWRIAVPDYQQKDFHTVTAYVYGRLDLVDFLVQVLGAKERHRGSNPEMFHGEFTIGDSVIMVGIGKSIPPEFRPPAQWGVRPDSKEPPPGTFYVYVSDVEAAYKRALQMGMTSLSEAADQDWGDRMAGVRDSYGNHWWIATFTGSK
jgi:PhnB protein